MYDYIPQQLLFWPFNLVWLDLAFSKKQTYGPVTSSESGHYRFTWLSVDAAISEYPLNALMSHGSVLEGHLGCNIMPSSEASSRVNALNARTLQLYIDMWCQFKFCHEFMCAMCVIYIDALEACGYPPCVFIFLNNQDLQNEVNLLVFLYITIWIHLGVHVVYFSYFGKECWCLISKAIRLFISMLFIIKSIPL